SKPASVTAQCDTRRYELHKHCYRRTTLQCWPNKPHCDFVILTSVTFMSTACHCPLV
ncbi:hypothetical protein J6590_005883, partial [Homalodisca vitripennis]